MSYSALRREFSSIRIHLDAAVYHREGRWGLPPLP